MQRIRIKKIADISLSVAMLCVCSWIAIPTVPPITAQTLAVFMIALLFPMWEGLLSLCVYIALGCLVPVFSGFQSIGALLASAGAGYVLGFFFIVIACALARKISDRAWVVFLFSLIGLFICYLLGALWYWFVYTETSVGILTVLGVCVLPFLVPDVIKLIIALLIYERIQKSINTRLEGN